MNLNLLTGMSTATAALLIIWERITTAPSRKYLQHLTIWLGYLLMFEVLIMFCIINVHWGYISRSSPPGSLPSNNMVPNYFSKYCSSCWKLASDYTYIVYRWVIAVRCDIYSWVAIITTGSKLIVSYSWSSKVKLIEANPKRPEWFNKDHTLLLGTETWSNRCWFLLQAN